MAGWFRKELRGSQDFAAGLKVRIGGFAGKVFQTLGAEPAMLPKDAIYGALEAGTLDAFKSVEPYDDEKLGDHKDGTKQPISKVAPLATIPDGGRAAGKECRSHRFAGKIRRAAQGLSERVARGGGNRRPQRAREIRAGNPSVKAPRGRRR